MVALSLFAIAVFGPQFATMWRPPAGLYLDFVQDWLSARNYWTGQSIYASQQVSIERHTGIRLDRALKWERNAHPPASVLAVLPFGLVTSYRDAHALWNLAMFPSYLLALLVLAWNLRIPFRLDTLLVAFALTVSSYPLMIQLGQGQFNLLLLLLLVLGWSADRRGHEWAAGLSFGLAAGIKLFPAFVFAYLTFSGRWRALLSAVLTMVAINGIAWAVLGTETFTTYIRDSLPNLEVYRASWRNVSITGFWSRLLGPDSVTTTACIATTSLLIICVVAWLARRATRCDTVASDRAFAATLVAMLLISPIVWTHYFVLLVPPLLILWDRLEPGWQRFLLYLTLPVLWAPEGLFVNWLLGVETARSWVNSDQVGAPLWINLLVFPLFTYTIFVLFALTAIGRWRQDDYQRPRLKPEVSAPG